MPRKKKEDEQMPEIKPKTRVVEATTTQKWKQPITIPVEDMVELESEDIENEDNDDDDFEEIEIESRPVKRSPGIQVKNKFKDVLHSIGIGNKEIASLRIDRLPNYEIDGKEGTKAITRFVDKIEITPQEIKEEKHLNVLKKYGPGAYQLTLRHGSTNLGMWTEQIDGNAASPVTRTVVGDDSSQSAFYPAPQTPAVAAKSLKEQLSEAVDLLTLVRKMDGRSEANAQQIIQPPISDDVQMATMLLKDPDVKAKAIKGLLGTAGHETDLTVLLIENGPGLLEGFGKMMQGIIQQAVIGIDHIRSKNGQAQAGSPQISHSNGNHSLQFNDQTTNESQAQIHENGVAQTNPQSWQGAQDQNAGAGNPIQNVSPEDQALDFILGQCQQKVPIKIAADRLFNVAEEIRKKAPANSIDGYVEMFADTPLDFLVQWLGSSYPDSQTVLDMPHAKDWIAGLQEEVRRQINEGGEDEE